LLRQKTLPKNGKGGKRKGASQQKMNARRFLKLLWAFLRSFVCAFSPNFFQQSAKFPLVSPKVRRFFKIRSAFSESLPVGFKKVRRDF